MLLILHPQLAALKVLLCVCVCGQRFKGTDPVEDVTEQVKAVKVEEKPKEVKAEVVDEVLNSWFIGMHFLLNTSYLV